MSFEKQKTIKEQVTLTIDGKSITAKWGKTVLEVALENDIYIPSLCWLKKLSPIGSCRVCVVEVEGAEDPMTACQLPVNDDLVITTQSEKLTKLRSEMIRMVLVNHPVDCPVCERSGECSLQDSTYEFGITMPENQAKPVKRERHWNDWGLVRYDPNLCVLCERCIRVCREIQGVDAYKIDKKGYESEINTKDEKPLDCDFCGQCIAVCPVGALNSAIILKSRSWDFKKVNSICGYCGVGCSLTLDAKQGKVVRVSSNDEIGANTGNLCVRGRFGYEFVNSGDRLVHPLVRQGNRLVEATWDEALTVVVEKLKEIKRADGGASIAAIGSERSLNEDNYVLQKFFRAVLGSNNIDTVTNMRNRSLGSSIFDELEVSPILSSEIISGGDLFLGFGADVCEENPVVGNMVRMAARKNEAPVLIAHSQKITYNPAPDMQIQYQSGSEVALVNAIAKDLLALNGGKAKREGATNIEEYVAYLQNATADKTGVSAEEVTAYALAISKKKSPVILVGSSVYKSSNALQVMQALQNLAEVAGGKTVLYREFCNTQGANDMGVTPHMLPGYQKLSDATVVEQVKNAWGCEVLPVDVPGNGKDVVELAAEGAIKTLIVMGEDLVSRYHDGKVVQEALNKSEFTVVMDFYVSDTMRFADVVLPATAFSEREGTMTNMEGRVQRLNKAANAPGDAIAPWEIINELGKRMSELFHYKSSSEISKEISEVAPLYSEIEASGLGDAGKVLNYASAEKAFTYKLVDSSVPDLGAGDGEFNLTVGNNLFYFPPLTQMSDRISQFTPDCYVEINNEDAEGLDICEGSSVTIESNGSKQNFVARLTEKAAKGFVYVPSFFADRSINSLFSGKESVVKVKVAKMN